MTDWLVASNPRMFDIDRAFLDQDVIDWSEVPNARLRSGDRVFLYQVRPVQAITHVCEVVATGIGSADMLDDREFWVDAAAFDDRSDRTWMRLSLLDAVPEDNRASLGLEKLREAGLKAAPQGRVRAPAAVAALVSEVLDHQAPNPSELIQRERDVIAHLGIGRSAWRFQRGQRGGTISIDSYRYALSMPEAPKALAMLRSYLNAVDLAQTDHWSVSAMPSWSGPTDMQRFATVSGASIELFYVWFESSTGTVTEWGARIPEELAAAVPPHAYLVQRTARSGDIEVAGNSLSGLLEALDHHAFLNALRTTSAQRKGARRARWHNPFLGDLLSAADTPSRPDQESSTAADIEFERNYIWRVTKHRLHQRSLRHASLRKYGARCMYCNLDIPEVLEASHVIPDSEGGAASTANILILCANHHTAFDAGLIVLDKNQPVPAAGAPRVPPHPPQVD